MKHIAMISTAVLSLTLGIAAPPRTPSRNSEPPDREEKKAEPENRRAKPAREESRAAGQER